MKADRYADLVRRRKACTLCAPDLANPAYIEGGRFDSEQIGPYTRWQNDLDARVVVVGKDFAPVARFIGYSGRPADTRTNRQILQHLRDGFPNMKAPDEDSPCPGLFFTNAVLCLAGGRAMRSMVAGRHVRTCARAYLRDTIDLVGPLAVATLGLQATEGTLHAFGATDAPSFAELKRLDAGWAMPGGIRLFAMPHPVASVKDDVHDVCWRRLHQWLASS